MAANDLQELLLETFSSHWEVEHFAELLHLWAKVRVWQVGEEIDTEVIIKLNILVVVIDVKLSLDSCKILA